MAKILVVEDDAMLQKADQQKLLFEGFEVEVANNGKEALEKLQQTTFDVILLDLNMPVMTGWEFIEKIKADPKLCNIPIIVLTNVFADGEELVQKWNVKYFLIKSNVNLDDVVEKINYILNPTPPPQGPVA